MKRADEGRATQKISREQLEEALKRTKSGTRRAVRSDPAFSDLPEPEVVDFLGPRDDTVPQLAHIDPSSLTPAPRVVAVATVATVAGAPAQEPVEISVLVAAVEVVGPVAVAVVAPVAPTEAVVDDDVEQIRVGEPSGPVDTSLRLQPRTAFVVGIAMAVLLALAAIMGFFAGRTPPR